jgi:hypothetical protein
LFPVHAVRESAAQSGAVEQSVLAAVVETGAGVVATVVLRSI